MVGQDDAQAWRAFHARHARLKPPLRPNNDVAAAIAAAIDGIEGPALLLGVTPELAELADETIALDWSAEMIAHVWPGDGARRRAILGDWLEGGLPPSSCGAAIGDGSLSCLLWPGGYRRLFEILARTLGPGAPVAIRCYVTPDKRETPAEVGAAALAGRIAGFHALKWRLAMALVDESGDPNLPVPRILAAFDRLFPDRRALGEAAGWSAGDIAEIDAYAGSAAVYSFPRRGEILETVGPDFAGGRFERAGGYELAERCPLLRLERRR